jgi:hypothetical protein
MLARHSRREVEHAIKATLEQIALFQHGACMALHAWVGQKVSRGREQVGNHQFGDVLAVELATLQNLAGQASAQKSGTAGDQNTHEKSPEKLDE